MEDGTQGYCEWGTLGAAAAPSLNALVLCRFAQGLLLPFIFAVTVAFIAEECPGPEAVRVTGTYAVGTIAGGASVRVKLAGRPAAKSATELKPKVPRRLGAASWRSASRTENASISGGSPTALDP